MSVTFSRTAWTKTRRKQSNRVDAFRLGLAIFWFVISLASDGNKTKMLRPRPRPVKQQQKCILQKKLFCCNTHVCYQKITWCKNVKKVVTSNVWHCFCTYCTKEHRCLLHFSIIVSHSALSCTYSVGSKKYWPRLRPRPKLQDQDNDQKYKTKTKTEAGLRPVLSSH